VGEVVELFPKESALEMWGRIPGLEVFATFDATITNMVMLDETLIVTLADGSTWRLWEDGTKERIEL